MIHIVPVAFKESSNLEVDHLYINLTSKMQQLLKKTNDLQASCNLFDLLLEDQSQKKDTEALIVILHLF